MKNRENTGFSDSNGSVNINETSYPIEFEFEKLWNKYYLKLILFIKPYFKKNNNETEDAAQEVLFKVFRNLKQYNSNYSLNTWIYRIARNYCIDRIRASDRKNRFENELIKDLKEAP